MTVDQKEDAIERLKIFKRWFLDKVMCIDKYTSFMVLPIEEIASRYRDEPPPCVTDLLMLLYKPLKRFRSPIMPKGIGMLDIAPTLGAPELVIPGKQRCSSSASIAEPSLSVGEMAYESRVSKRREFLPVAVSLMGPPGESREFETLGKQLT